MRRLAPPLRPLVDVPLSGGISSVTLSVQARMLSHLHDATTLASRSRRTTVLACALTEAVLAPCVDLLLLGGVMSDERDPELGQVIAYMLWSRVMAGALGGLVPHLAFRASTRWRLLATVGHAAVAGVLQLGLLLLATLPGEVAARGAVGLEVIGVAGLLGALGSIVSAPMGAGFGVLFLVSMFPASWSLDEPSQDGPAQVSIAAAVQLAIAAMIALALLLASEGRYCQALFVVALPSLGVELPEGSDLAWTRFLLASPLAIGALLALARGVWSLLAFARSVRALRRGEHPRWVLTLAEASQELVMPLLARDRGVRLLEVVAREDVAPYRGSTPAITAIAEGA